MNELADIIGDTIKENKFSAIWSRPPHLDTNKRSK
jgi:hypothetical protein